MSDFVATVLQNYINQYDASLDKLEQRPSNYGAMNLFKAQNMHPTSIISPEVEANIEQSFNVSVQVPVVNYREVTIANVRTCAVQTEGLTSSLVTLTHVTYAVGFVARPEQHYENYVGYQSAINRNITASVQKLAEAVDIDCSATLEANKNQYFPQELLDYYAVVADAFQVGQAEKNDFYNNLGAILQTADHEGTAQVAVNPIGMPLVNRLESQGQQNGINEAFQMLGYDWFPTNRVVNGGAPGTYESTLYAVVPGSVGMASRVDPAAKTRQRIHEGKFWDVFPNAPQIGMDLGVFYQKDCADISAVQSAGLANSTRTTVESWEFSLDVFYVSAYNSDPVNRYGNIFKAEILA